MHQEITKVTVMSRFDCTLNSKRSLFWQIWTRKYVYIWNLACTWSDTNLSMTKYASRIPLIVLLMRLGWRYRPENVFRSLNVLVAHIFLIFFKMNANPWGYSSIGPSRHIALLCSSFARLFIRIIRFSQPPLFRNASCKTFKGQIRIKQKWRYWYILTDNWPVVFGDRATVHCWHS